jgi:hypothetical protein
MKTALRRGTPILAVRIRAILALYFLLLSQCPTMAQVDMSLSPAADDLPNAIYHSAALCVSNRGAPAVRAVRIRMKQGGPAIFLPLSVPPEANVSAAVRVPACVPEQEYALAALAEDSPFAAPIARQTATVSWPPGRLGAAEMLAPDLYARNEDKSAGWSGSMLRGMFIAAGLACAAMSACLFLQRPIARLALVGAIAAAGAIGGLIWLARAEAPRHSVIAGGADTGPGAPPADIVAISSPRTLRWNNSSPRLLPLYASPADMARDDAVIDPRAGISLTLHGGQVRIFLLPQP